MAAVRPTGAAAMAERASGLRRGNFHGSGIAPDAQAGSVDCRSSTLRAAVGRVRAAETATRRRSRRALQDIDRALWRAFRWLDEALAPPRGDPAAGSPTRSGIDQRA